MTTIPNLANAFFQSRPTQSPVEWCRENVFFNEASYKGPFKTDGTEYIIEPLNLFADRTINDVVLCWGSQTHKTGTLMGGVGWVVSQDPCGLLWVMPTINLANKFSKQRWKPMLKATGKTSCLIPYGAARHDFGNCEQILLNGAVVNFVGSNSPGNLSSNPCRRVVLDEVDKFDEGGRGEADAVNLAEQRTKDQPDPQRWKTSTPTIFEGLIWQAMLKGDMRRYFVPCPGCWRRVVLSWSRQYTVIDLTGNEAFVVWDKEARLDRGWDLERVRRSARAECPYCGFHILSAHKAKLNKQGEWVATRKSSPSFRSYHLPSLYSPSPECDFGRLAVKFLEAKASLQGMQGFINGDLAEPDMSQADQNKVAARIRTESIGCGAKLLTVDCQAKSPFFWWVAREWSEGQSHAIECGNAETIGELEQIAERLGIKPDGIMLDSGFGAYDDAEVYRNCANHCEYMERPNSRPLGMGWLPSKGMPGRRRWKDASGAYVPFAMVEIDPYVGTDKAGLVSINLFEFSGDAIKDALNTLQNEPDKFAWSVSEQVGNNEDYGNHMKAENKTLIQGRVKQFYRWEKRHKSLPNHLWDCEVMQVAFAMMLGIVKL